jgi:uncharacterized tellurite resistance protein B-like protein
MSVIPQLKLLVNLARIDGEVDEKENSYIVNIAKANGVAEKEASELLANSHEIIIPENFTEEQRFESIFNLVQLMKIDEKLFQNEIRYCSKVASKLGYDQGIMFELMLNVKNIMMDKQEVETLKQQTRKYLKIKY